MSEVTKLSKTIGKHLRTAREDRGISRYDFAVKSGVHINMVTSIESGHYNLSLQMIERIAAGLDMDPVELVSGRFTSRVLPSGSNAPVPRASGPWFPSQHFGACVLCRERFAPGDWIRYDWICSRHRSPEGHAH